MDLGSSLYCHAWMNERICTPRSLVAPVGAGRERVDDVSISSDAKDGYFTPFSGVSVAAYVSVGLGVYLRS